MKLCFITFGCKVNQAESQKWEKILRHKGYVITNNQNEADCWIINTCAVTHKAEVQSRQIINKVRKLNKKTFVTGCYVELCKINECENLKVISNFEKDNLINKFNTKTESDTLKISRHRAIVKIQDGCDQFCSYCIVPYLRGNPRSYKIEDILKEIKDYELIGIKEIVLSGINIGLYGKDLENKINLNKFLKVLLKETSGFRIRVSSIEVNHIDDEFLEIISDSRICKHLHIPLQHGSNRILLLMNRPYTIDEFTEKIEKILKLYPDISIGTDIIIGFPNETDEDFKKTLEVIEKTEFSYLHLFPYSRRPFTKALELSGQIPEEIKKERTNYLLDIAQRKKSNYIKKFIGCDLEIVVENKKNGLFLGTSDNYIKCLVDSSSLKEGSLIKIRVKSSDGKYAFSDEVFSLKP